MKLTLEPTEDTNYPKVTIEIKHDHTNLEEVMEALIKPALISWGFNPLHIEEYI